MRKLGVGTFTSTEEMRANLNTIMDTSRLSYGPFCRELESRFAEIHDCNYAILCNSGTDALRIALQTLKEAHNWNDGDEVIVPAVTFVATINIILQLNLKPVLVDVELETYGINPELIEDSITQKTRAIIPVNLFGQPCLLAEIQEIAYKDNLKIIEDSCEAMFVKHWGKSVGAWSDIGCFSMYVAHLLTAGVGGIMTTNNPEYAAIMRSLANHGRNGIYISIDDDNNVSGKKQQEIVSKRFQFERIGYSSRISELGAAVALPQLDTYSEMIMQRQLNACTLTKELRHLATVIPNKGRIYNIKGEKAYMYLPSEYIGNQHAYMMYPILLRSDMHKDGLVNHLETNGIGTREMLPIINQPCYKQFGWNDMYKFPNATWINNSGFYVGCHQDLGKEDMLYIADKIKEYFE